MVPFRLDKFNLLQRKIVTVETRCITDKHNVTYNTHSLMVSSAFNAFVINSLTNSSFVVIGSVFVSSNPAAFDASFDDSGVDGINSDGDETELFLVGVTVPLVAGFTPSFSLQ